MHCPRTVAVLVVAGALSVFGCGTGGPPTYSVSGKVEVVSGNAADLAGSTLEASLQSDPTVRASGVIGPDGRFTLETLHAGKILRGAQEGSYAVRILLPDDDPTTRRKAAKAVAPRFLKFDTSGLSFQVPPRGDVTLSVTAR